MIAFPWMGKKKRGKNKRCGGKGRHCIEESTESDEFNDPEETDRIEIIYTMATMIADNDGQFSFNQLVKCTKQLQHKKNNSLNCKKNSQVNSIVQRDIHVLINQGRVKAGKKNTYYILDQAEQIEIKESKKKKVEQRKTYEKIQRECGEVIVDHRWIGKVVVLDEVLEYAKERNIVFV